jgi:hypothetical protein
LEIALRYTSQSLLPAKTSKELKTVIYKSTKCISIHTSILHPFDYQLPDSAVLSKSKQIQKFFAHSLFSFGHSIISELKSIPLQISRCPG